MIYKVKIIYLKKIRLNEVSSKVTTFLRKCFYPKILKWQKVSDEEKKIEKVQICQNPPTPLRPLDVKSTDVYLTVKVVER
jgi:hypothetical protein